MIRKNPTQAEQCLIKLLLLLCLGITAGCSTAQPATAPDVARHERAMFDPATATAAGAAVGTAPRIVANALLYYIPNRIIDFIDIWRVDVGVGVSYGAVIRASRYAQAGYRGFAPRSVRFGLRGRRSPIFVERYPEYGVSPGFVNTGARVPTPFEVGVGADLLAVGAYAGISLDELGDFLAGIFFFDPKGDDLRFD